jgi:hypothetical protein
MHLLAATAFVVASSSAIRIAGTSRIANTFIAATVLRSFLEVS